MYLINQLAALDHPWIHQNGWGIDPDETLGGSCVGRSVKSHGTIHMSIHVSIHVSIYTYATWVARQKGD